MTEIERLRALWEDKRATYDELLVQYFGPGSQEVPPDLGRPPFLDTIEQALADERAAWQSYSSALSQGPRLSL